MLKIYEISVTWWWIAAAVIGWTLGKMVSRRATGRRLREMGSPFGYRNFDEYRAAMRERREEHPE